MGDVEKTGDYSGAYNPMHSDNSDNGVSPPVYPNAPPATTGTRAWGRGSSTKEHKPPRYLTAFCNPAVWKTWIFALFVAFPLSTFIWTLDLTLFCTAFGMIILIIGLPLVFCWAYLTIALAQLDKVVMSALFEDLAEEYGVYRLELPRIEGDGFIAKLKAMFSHADLYKSSIWVLLVQFPLDLCIFVVTLSLSTVAFGLIVWPLVLHYCEPCQASSGSGGDVDQAWREFYSSVGGQILLAVIGVLMVPASMLFSYYSLRFRARISFAF